MTEYRGLIKSFLYQEDDNIHNYKWLKHCLQCDDTIDEWFKGVIGSLFYKPNTRLLAVVGEYNILPELLPEPFKMMYSYNYLKQDAVYDNLILQVNIEGKKDFATLNKHCFRLGSNLQTDKRLASYAVYQTEWSWSERKNVIVLNTNNIDFETYLKIDKMSLWRQLFKNFKP